MRGVRRRFAEIGAHALRFARLSTGIRNVNELILPPQPRQSKNESRARPTIEIVVEPRERATKQSRRGPISALLGAAAIIGAGVYVFQLAQSAMPKQAPAPVAAKATDAGLSEAQRQIAGLQNEIRDLRAKLDAVEKRQPAEAAKAAAPEPDKAAIAAPAPREAPSASVPVTPPAPPPQPPTTRAEPPAPVQKVAPTPPRIVSGFRLRDAFRGNALVETSRGVIDVQPGDVLPGAGRVLAIQRRGGRWVVATESGDIVGDTPAQARPAAPRRRPVYREEYGYETGPLAPRMFMPF